MGGALLTGVLVGAGTTAFAGQALSQTGYYTIAGHQYATIAAINTSPNNAYAVTVNQWSSGGTLAGWAGARARLFTESGSMACESANTYNSTTGGVANPMSCFRITSGSWYSYGVALGWNGSGYSPFYTFRSPNQNS